jgi:hypothetical protein
MKIESILLTLVLIVFLISMNINKTYCDGWKKGYVEGWCYKDLNCINPVLPICPIPDPNFNNYDYGRKDGFEKGRKDRLK